jgi:hypothetical protein
MARGIRFRCGLKQSVLLLRHERIRNVVSFSVVPNVGVLWQVSQVACSEGMPPATRPPAERFSALDHRKAASPSCRRAGYGNRSRLLSM